MNMNEFAKRIASQEGKVQSLSIAQIKEVIGLIADEFYLRPGHAFGGFVELGGRRARRRVPETSGSVMVRPKKKGRRK